MQVSTLKTDLSIHVGCLLLQMVLLYMHGFGWEGSAPPFVYPFWIILSTITLFRANEQLSDFGSKIVLIPLLLSCLTIGFCLINEIGAVFWAFYTPRWYPVWVRILWYQSTLLLLHPQIYTIIYKHTQTIVYALHQRGYFSSKIIFTFIIAGILLWLIRSQNLSPDGYDWLKHSVYEKNWTRYLREPMGTFILRTWVYWGMHWFHLAPYVSISLLTICCGFVSSVCLYKTIQHLFDPEFVNPVYVLVLCTFGFTQVFAGNIEIYALLQTGLLLFLFSLVCYWKRSYVAYWVGIWFGILFCIHLSAGWWLPAFFLFPFLKHDWKNVKGWVTDITLSTLSMFLVCGSFGLFVLGYGYQWDVSAIYNHFWSDQVMLVGTDAAMFRPITDYMSSEYYLTMMNEYYFMFSGGCFLLLTLIFCIPNLSISKQTLWLIILTAFYFIYSLTWRPDRHFPADWDLFSGLTIPFILLLSSLLIQSKLPKPAIHFILYQCTVFSGIYMFLQMLRNHLQISEWPPFL